MPNWVCAGFNVTGERTELERFTRMMIRPSTEVGVIARRATPSPQEVNAFDKDAPFKRTLTLDFNGIIPSPPEDARLDWERWAVEHWGTKWNAQHVDVRVDPDNVWFQFMTAWDFPTPVFEALAAEFPALVFAGSAYEESGELELIGEFNGDNDWGPGVIQWMDLNDVEVEATDEGATDPPG